MKRICSECGSGLRRDNKDGLCWKHRMRNDRKSEHDGPGRGHRIHFQGDTCICKMCGKKFPPKSYQDARFTWYCPSCRKDVAVVTVGVLWLERLGLRVPPSKHIIETSLADALDPEKRTNEKTIRQTDHDKGGPGGGTEQDLVGGEAHGDSASDQEEEIEGPELSNTYF